MKFLDFHEILNLLVPAAPEPFSQSRQNFDKLRLLCYATMPEVRRYINITEIEIMKDLHENIAKNGVFMFTKCHGGT